METTFKFRLCSPWPVSRAYREARAADVVLLRIAERAARDGKILAAVELTATGWRVEVVDLEGAGCAMEWDRPANVLVGEAGCAQRQALRVGGVL